MGRKKDKKSRNRVFLREILKFGVVGLQLGLIGFVFHIGNWLLVIGNWLYGPMLRSFKYPANWLCFA